MTTNPDNLNLKIVEWLDATCISAWCAAGTPLEPIKAVTCGFVLHEDETYIQLAGTVAQDGEYNQCMTIPKGMILSVKDA
jgi:hypothetical protein